MSEEIDLEEKRPLPFTSIAGGRSFGNNWLLKLKEGSVFLTREDTGGTVFCMQFHLRKKWNRGVWLHSNFPGTETNDFVDSIEFSKKYILIELLQDGYGEHSLHTGPKLVENDEHDTAEH